MWDLCVVLHTIRYLISFKYGDCEAVYGFYIINFINGEGTIDQEIIVNNIFHLWGRGPSKVLLEVSIFVQYFNFSFIEIFLITRDRTKKRGILGNSIYSSPTLCVTITTYKTD